MTEPTKPLSIVKLLAKYGIYPAKRFGQNFLLDKSHLSKLLEPKELQQVSTILEIGPGPGNLTELLLKTPANVIAVEIDKRFGRLLDDRFGKNSNFHLVQADVLDRGKINPTIISKLKPTSDNWALVSNLPYQAATTIIVETLYLPFLPKVMCVTIQKEVARRLLGSPGNKDFSALTVLVQARANVKLISHIPPGAFWPSPKVSSSTVSITPFKKSNIIDINHLRKIVNQMFTHRRKTLRAGFLKKLPLNQQSITKEAFGQLGIDPKARAEQLNVIDFIELSNLLIKCEKTQ